MDKRFVKKKEDFQDSFSKLTFKKKVHRAEFVHL